MIKTELEKFKEIILIEDIDSIGYYLKNLKAQYDLKTSVEGYTKAGIIIF